MLRLQFWYWPERSAKFANAHSVWHHNCLALVVSVFYSSNSYICALTELSSGSPKHLELWQTTTNRKLRTPQTDFKEQQALMSTHIDCVWAKKLHLNSTKAAANDQLVLHLHEDCETREPISLVRRLGSLEELQIIIQSWPLLNRIDQWSTVHLFYMFEYSWIGLSRFDKCVKCDMQRYFLKLILQVFLWCIDSL